jgi:PilZ domain
LNRRTDSSSSEWDKWNHLLPNWNQRDRHSLMQMVRVERSTLRVVEDEQPIPQIMGLTVNVSSGGLCLLVDWLPKLGEIMRVHLPMATVEAKTPTLADVRWVRLLPFEGTGLVIVGVKFIV